MSESKKEDQVITQLVLGKKKKTSLNIPALAQMKVDKAWFEKQFKGKVDWDINEGYKQYCDLVRKLPKAKVSKSEK